MIVKNKNILKADEKFSKIVGKIYLERQLSNKSHQTRSIILGAMTLTRYYQL